MDTQSSTSIRDEARFPPLPYADWKPTKTTLHLYLQVIGKVRLTLMPKQNHWWHVPLYVSPRGLTTQAVPAGARVFEIEFDMIDHRVHVRCSDGAQRSFDVHDGLTVARFYVQLMEALDSLGITVDILAKPFDHESEIPFAEDDTHHQYDAHHVHRFWRVLTHIEPIFQRFRGRFVGKATPVHLFWHSFDLAYTRFSGRPVPSTDGMDPVTAEAYSHEVISFGFWAGDEKVPHPAFYSYTYPEPEGLTAEPLKPHMAHWRAAASGSQAIYLYDDMRHATDPEQALLDFLESAYRAGATLAGWDVNALTRTS